MTICTLAVSPSHVAREAHGAKTRTHAHVHALGIAFNTTALQWICLWLLSRNPDTV